MVMVSNDARNHLDLMCSSGEACIAKTLKLTAQNGIERLCSLVFYRWTMIKYLLIKCSR